MLETPESRARVIDVATTASTPVYVYDAAAVRARIRAVRAAFSNAVAVLYAVKANPHPDLLRAIEPQVDGADVASAGEVRAAMAAGFAPKRLRLAGPGKTAALLAQAVADGIPISVESPEELEDVANLAARRQARASVFVRLEPRQPRHTFAVQMGTPSHPFGMDAAETERALAILGKRTDDLRLKGVHVYGGSGCRSVRGWLGYLAEALDLAYEVSQAGGPLEEINVGGGFGVASSLGPALDVATLGARAGRMLAKFPAAPRFVVELGRFLVADAGAYVCRVVRVKHRPGHRIAVLDGGVNHLWAATGQLGPPPRPVVLHPARPATEPTQLMGPLCTPLDALGRIEETVAPGDLIAFDGVGAYGATMSPQAFLGHGPAREVVLDDVR